MPPWWRVSRHWSRRDRCLGRAAAPRRVLSHAQRLGLDHAFDLPGTVDRIGEGDHLVHRTAGDGGDIEVLAVDLVEVMALAHAPATFIWGHRC